MEWNHFVSSGRWGRPQGFQNNPKELRSLENNYSYLSNLPLKWGQRAQYEENIWLNTAKNTQLQDYYNVTLEKLNAREERGYRQFSFGHRLIRNGTLRGTMTTKTGTDLGIFLRKEGWTNVNMFNGQSQQILEKLLRSKFPKGPLGSITYGRLQ